VLFLLVLLRIVLRRERSAAIGLVLVIGVVQALGWSRQGVVLPAVAGLLVAALITFVLVRFGTLALAAGLLTSGVLSVFPISASFATWYASAGLFALGVLGVMLVHGLRSALAGRSLFEMRVAGD
jgi:hypothetical protein